MINDRLESILDAFAQRPHASIPEALLSRNELEAAYRFCDNKKTTPEKILQPHVDATKQRCRYQKIVLCAQDTTELDFTRPEQQVNGTGPLDSGARLGAFFPLNEAFTEDGTPLGAIGAKLWSRPEADPEQPKPSKAEKRKQRRLLPIEQKEKNLFSRCLRVKITLLTHAIILTS